MNTKVRKRSEIPAGILSDIEIFTVEDGKKIYAIHIGVRKDFSELPSIVQQFFREEAQEDKEFTAFAKRRWGVEAFSEVFWYRMDCLYGALDETPDFNLETGENTVDVNSWCGDLDCEMAGKRCRLPHDLKKDEVLTIILVKRGNTVKKMAPQLHIEVPSVVSRVEKLKVKFNANNTPELAGLTYLIHTTR
jgi:hypothetical protein